LAQHLSRLKQEGRGVVLVSHELDWALPLADRVLLLKPDGAMMDCMPSELVAHPERLALCGLQAPMWLRIAAAYGGALSGEAWRSPQTFAQAISAVGSGSEGPAGEIAPMPRHERSAPTARRRQSAHRHRLAKFDPRAIWLGYALLSIGLFSLSTWPGLLAGAAVVVGIIAASCIPLRRFRGVIIGYMLFGLLFAGWAAVEWFDRGSVRIGWDHAVFVGTVFPFARTLIVLLIGLGVPLVMTPLSLRRALEQLVPGRRRTPAVWQRIVLTITLTIRFVPVLLAEWERFGRIFLSRGKDIRRTPAAFIRKLRDIALPLLLALFRMADEVALALESRGVRQDVQPTRGTNLKWRKRDTMLAAAAVALGALLWFMA